MTVICVQIVSRFENKPNAVGVGDFYAVDHNRQVVVVSSQYSHADSTFWIDLQHEATRKYCHWNPEYGKPKDAYDYLMGLLA